MSTISTRPPSSGGNGQHVQDGQVDRQQADEEQLADERGIEQPAGLLGDTDRTGNVTRGRRQAEHAGNGARQSSGDLGGDPGGSREALSQGIDRAIGQRRA